MAELVENQNPQKRMEKQIGCISGFLHIFHAQPIFPKRLPPPTLVGASPETLSSPDFSPKNVVVMPGSPDVSQSANAITTPPRKPTPFFPTKDETPRLSLNGKPAVADGGDENQRRSPSVIARLMGLEPLSSSDHKTPQHVARKPALRRSASESSRVSRDLFHSKYIDGNNFQVKQPKQQTVEHNVNRESVNLKSEASRTSPWKSRRSSFDSEDFFPEPNGDFDKKLRMRGMDEQQSNDLGALKQILEVLQLKGLLHHSTGPPNGDHRHRNFVYVRNLPSDESSIVLMKPWRSKADNVQRSVNDSRGMRRENSPAREGGGVDRSPARARNSSSPTRIESNLKSCNSIVKRKPLSIEIQRRPNESSDSVRSSPINSPKLPPKITGSKRSPRNQKPSEPSAINSPKQKIFKNVVTTEDESSSISKEGNRHGRSLLQRCDKLLHNIAEMNSTTTESPPLISTTVLPSPVSVLDSVFDKDESSSPSHSIDFKVPPAVKYEDESCSPTISPTKSTQHEEFSISDDSDFLYISEILGISPYLQHEEFVSDRTVFSLVEKQLYNNITNSDSTNTSKRHHRKLVFDVVVEILDRKKRQFPPWKKTADSRSSLKQIWSEFEKIREINTAGGDGMMEVIRGVLRKDLIEMKGWIDDDHPVETSEAVLNVERMIFKDLVNEAIGDLAQFPAKCVFSRTQRKLVF